MARLGIDTSIHKLRTYNATELLTSGLDIRKVAGRRGHGSGGVPTMRHYSAWVSEADQRAAGTIAPRMPARPQPADLPPRVEIEPKHPFERSPPCARGPTPTTANRCTDSCSEQSSDTGASPPRSMISNWWSALPTVISG